MITSSTHPPPSRKHSTVQMGQSSSNRRRREEYYPQNPNPNPSPSSSSNPLPPLPPTPPPPPPPYPPNYSNPYPAPPPACSYYSQHHTSSYGPPVRYYNHFMGRSGYPGILPGGQGSGWWPSGSSSSSSSSPWMMPGPQQLPPPYVEHQKAKTIKNDVNLHKDTIRLEPDPQNPDHHLVSFTYDSLVDGSVTIFYFAKEGADCSFSPVYPDMYMPVAITFEKGVHQKFCQPSGSGVDLGFFEYDALSKPSSDDVFPLVIYAEACPPPPPGENGHSKAATRAQITLAVIERKADETFLVKVVKQILWVDGERYELQEIFGLGSSAETGVDGNGDEDDENMGKECVICLSEPRDTAVLPCRHMCMCSECAKALRLQSNKCPICRQPVEKLMEIKVKREVEQ